MTRQEALELVCDIAARWGENSEEGLPCRIDPEMTDAQIKNETGETAGGYDYDTAIEVRDLWQAIAVLSNRLPPTPAREPLLSSDQIVALLKRQAALRAPENDVAGVLLSAAEHIVEGVNELEE
jgi:hypothetical protein